MNFYSKNEAVVQHRKGRTVYAVFEEAGKLCSENLVMGFARFDSAMDPHQHVEECMYVVDCYQAYARCGESKDTLGERHAIQPGMFMWADQDEWHVFEFEDGGFMDIIFCLPRQSFVRPE